MRRLLITGGGGFVGGHVIQQAAPGWSIDVVSGKPPLIQRDHLVWHTLDLSRPDGVGDLIANVRPDVVLHLAAVADIDFCERRPEIARRINVDLTAAIAERGAAVGCRLVFVSTDNVFDGRKGDYREDDPPTPINEYARSKAAAEAHALTASTAVVARAALVMGFGALGRGNSFVDRTLVMLRKGDSISVPPEEIRTPIDVITLSWALIELCAIDFHGILHLAGTEAVDRVRLTRRLAVRLGFSPDLVVPRAPTEIAGRAPRPRDVSLNCDKARTILKTRMLDFDAGIDSLLAVSADRAI